MKISETIKNKLIKELEFIIKKMKSEEDNPKKLYYFSAVFGAFQRIYNIDFDTDLVFAHMVTNATYNAINLRLSNPDKIVQLPPEIFNKMIEITEELKVTIQQNKDLYEVLKKFSLLGFITSGNGYYLYQRKLVKI